MGGGYLQHPAEAEAGVHELHQPEQQLQRVDVPMEAVPQVDVLHLCGRGYGKARCRLRPGPQPPPRKAGPTHLHGHDGAVMQPGTVHLGQAGGGDWLVVKFLEELVGRGVEVLKEQLVHLAGGGS